MYATADDWSWILRSATGTVATCPKSCKRRAIAHFATDRLTSTLTARRRDRGRTSDFGQRKLPETTTPAGDTPTPTLGASGLSGLVKSSTRPAPADSAAAPPKTSVNVRFEPDCGCEPATSADRKARRGCASSEFIITAAVAASAPNATIAMPAAARSCEGSTSVRGEGGGGGFAAGFSVVDAGRAIGAGFAAPAAASWSCRWTMAGSFVDRAQERASPPSHPFPRRSATRAGSSLMPASRRQLLPSPAAQAFSRQSTDVFAVGAAPLT